MGFSATSIDAYKARQLSSHLSLPQRELGDQIECLVNAGASQVRVIADDLDGPDLAKVVEELRIPGTDTSAQWNTVVGVMHDGDTLDGPSCREAVAEAKATAEGEARARQALVERARSQFPPAASLLHWP